MTNPMSVNAFDASNVSTQTRPLAGPYRTGTITYDVDYSATASIFARWLYIGTTGTLAYMKYDGTTETLPNISAGVWHPIPSIRILSSGTTIAANQIRWGD